MLLKTMMACTAIGAGVLLSAGEYLESFKLIVAKGAAESKAKYWQGRHFGDTPFQPNDKNLQRAQQPRFYDDILEFDGCKAEWQSGEP